MAKSAAFGTLFYLGTSQVETATVVGTCSGSGNIHVVCTSALIAGSPLQTVVAILNGDTATAVATKIRTALNLVAAITLNFIVGGTGDLVTLTAKLPAADEAALNIDYHMDGATAGLTDDLTSTTTTAGAAFVSIANVKNITGPSLKLDTEDVTSHDSTAGWEEAVGTVLREGEVKMDLVYDPTNDTHDATAVGGLAYCLKNKLLKHFKVTWPDTTAWTFPGYVAGFEPSSPSGGAITAAVSIRISGAPTLA